MKPDPFPLQRLALSNTPECARADVHAHMHTHICSVKTLQWLVDPCSLTPHSLGLFSGIKPSKAEPGQTLSGRLVASVVTWSFLFLAVLCAERVGQMTKTYNDWLEFILIKADITIFLGEECQKLSPLKVWFSSFLFFELVAMLALVTVILYKIFWILKGMY